MHADGQKVNAGHLKRNAYLYIRQSTPRQVVDHSESTKRQYALRQRAVALGWHTDRIVIIDHDQGQSGASAADRKGFQTLVAEVGMGHAGLVIGLEVSRLARNSSDWHRLLEICALTDTLILDEDGLYDPAHFNDRLLLGLKGTMSEAELHVMQARMRGGLLSKARRGELLVPLPVGFLYDVDGHVIRDADHQVQESIRFLFQSFRRLGSAAAVVKAFRDASLLFPHRPRGGPQDGELTWVKLRISRTLFVLHNPRYAGAFVYGRTRKRKTLEGQLARLPQDEWHTLLIGAHDGYISWDQYQENQRRLHENAHALGAERRKSPPREGPALLQGLVICGVCGDRMKVVYHVRGGRRVPDYVCDGRTVNDPQPICQWIGGSEVDTAVSDLLLDIMTPVAIDVTLAVQQELQARLDEVDRLRHEQVERAQYEAELAQRRYLRVDPDNRLVADTLEADWNSKLRALHEAHRLYEQERQKDRLMIDDELRTRLHLLATDFPRVWRDPATPDRERKRFVRLLLEDVTLIKRDQLLIHLRFPGGTTRTLQRPRPRRVTVTPHSIISEIDRLLDDHSYDAVASDLNARGFVSGYGNAFTGRMIGRLTMNYRLKSRFTRLREQGMLTLDEIAQQLGICTAQAKIWRAVGLLRAHRCNDKNEYLYEDPGPNPPQKASGVRLSKRRLMIENLSQRSSEVQYEA
ncbi:MAG TPA: recombinase family protein [Vicinamibacterales bacterium]|jgi:DNA invertase Pin-like site-specific DNA recombinase|nr:recombinase family protein [Vicinamibacterales bacterium]